MKRLTEQVIRLQQAAETVCTDKALVYDTIYLAVIKTKQKYKKLANKERATDVCISLMKQPKKHVKQSFASVEDCIEKALAAKIVPWKPIISVMAAVLAVAIILPLCLPEGVFSAEVGGFEMENTISIGNGYSDNGTYLKNLHAVEDFGGPNLTELTRTDMTQNLSGKLYHDTVSTSDDVTYMATAYLREDERNAEFILYRAETSGWIEIGRAPIGIYATTESYDGKETIHYGISSVYLLCDQRNNVYVVSNYRDGVQIHQCTPNGSFSLLGKQKLADLRSYTSSPVIASNIWINYSYAVLDEGTQTIAFLCDSNIPFLSSGGNSTNNPEICVTTYDLKKQAFNDPLYFENIRGRYTMGFHSDCAGGFYILLLDKTGTTFEFGANKPNNRGIYLYHLKDGILSKKLLVSDKNVNLPVVRMFEVDESGAIHLVYVAEMNRKIYYVKIVDNEILTTYNIVSTSEDDTKVDNFIAFYRQDEKIYYVELILNEYILLSWTDGTETKRVAEICLPQKYISYQHALYDTNKITLLSQGCMLNLILSASPVQETSFAQIICEYEPK